MTEVILYDSNNVLWNLDTDRVSIPVTYNIADVREPDKAKSNWSKTATFLGTANNNKAFKHLYEISGESDFNVNKKIRAVIVENGINTFFGFARLLNVKRKNNGQNDYNRISYEVSFFGETADLFKEINGLYLHDLDLSEWNHTYSSTVQINSATGNTVLNSVTGQNSITLGSALSITSFAYNSGYLQCNFSGSHGLSVGDEIYIVKASNTSNSHYNGFFLVKTVDSSTAVTLYMLYGDNVGTETATAYKVTMLGAGYVYPMIDYGLNFGDSWDVEHFFPSIYVKEYWDTILSDAGYTYDSNFLDSQFFKHLVIPFNSDAFTISNDEVLEREFKATYSADETTQTDSSTGVNYNFNISDDIIPDNDSTNGNNDDNGNYNTGTGNYTAPATGYYNFEWNVKAIVQPDSVPMGYTKVFETKQLIVVIKKNGTTIHSQWYAPDVTGSVANYQGTSPSLFVTASDIITFEYVVTYSYKLWDGASTYYTTSQDLDVTVKQGTYLQCRILDTVIQEGATVEINNAIPRDILQSDFISSIIRMFKLFVQPSSDNSKHLIIEPRDSFYGGTVLDWTSKLAIDRDIDIIPMAELNAKRYIFKYKSDKDAFNQNHETDYSEVYGTQTVDIDNDFVVGEQILEPVFSATPLIDYPVGTDRVISSIVKDGTITQNRTSSNIRILYYAVRGTKFSYDYTGNSGTTSLYTYPYAGHLDNVWSPYYDLNFGYPKATYYNYGAWTDNNLYNRFHRQYIEEITDRHSKILTAYLRIKPSDINNLDFANLIRIDSHLLRLNKIIDYDVNNDGLTKCEFIKVKSGYTWTPTFEKVSYGYDLMVGDELAPVQSGNSYNIGGSVNTPRLGGANNYYGGNNKGVTVNGNDNTISYGAKNVMVLGNGNTIGEVENVMVVGDDMEVTRSNTTYVNGVMVSGDGSVEYIQSNTTITLGVKTLGCIATFYDVDADGGDVTVTIPRADLLVGVPLHFKKIDNSANTVTITSSGGFEIDGDTSLIITTQYDNVMLVSSGTEWETR